tara:strand:+ start:3847 stop:3969 length:123 start_codon:yes stop_codon:yes gene_type:complete
MNFAIKENSSLGIEILHKNTPGKEKAVLYRGPAGHIAPKN